MSQVRAKGSLLVPTVQYGNLTLECEVVLDSNENNVEAALIDAKQQVKSHILQWKEEFDKLAASSFKLKMGQ